MNRFLLASTAGCCSPPPPAAQEPVNVGIILGFTGPLESITPDMAASAELAFAEASDVRHAARRRHDQPGPRRLDLHRRRRRDRRRRAAWSPSDNVAAIMGADCSGVTIAIANNVAVPNGVVMISPSATSPALSTIEDNDLFFRTAPSDARQGEILADVLDGARHRRRRDHLHQQRLRQGPRRRASPPPSRPGGGTVSITAPHEDGKGDYSAEVAALAGLGRRRIWWSLGYVDQGGVGIIQAALDTGAFDSFVSRRRHVRPEPDRRHRRRDSTARSSARCPASKAEAPTRSTEVAKAAGFDPTGTYAPESYDAARADRARDGGGRLGRPHRRSATRSWTSPTRPARRSCPANSPRASSSLAAGSDIDYVGATGVELIGPGEAAGTLPRATRSRTART